MDLRVITLENGMKMVTADRPAPTPEQSAFAAELERVAEAAKQAEASGSTKLQAAWSSLTPSSKAVLERMKAEEPNITEEEWDRLKRELAAMGLISKTDLNHTVNDLVVIGDLVQSGGGVVVRSDEAPNLDDIEWTGNPLTYMDQWIRELRKGVDPGLNRMEQVESYERLRDVVSKLLEAAGEF